MPSGRTTPPFLHDDPDQVRRQLEAGIAFGLDPEALETPQAASPSEPLRAVTTLRSRWLHRRCGHCGHTFRLDDRVSITSTGEVWHQMPGLDCVKADTVMGGPARESAKEIREFYAGLEKAWPMPGDVKTTRLEGDHPLLKAPQDGRHRRSCRICSHTFREGDVVVVCPCNPDLPGNCLASVHRDLVNRLHCWDEWAKGPLSDQCLAMA